MSTIITIYSLIEAPITKVWEAYTNVSDIKKWNFATDDWHCPFAENDLTVGGKFTYTMAAKDQSVQFNFSGTYTEISPYEKLIYVLDDQRVVLVKFEKVNPAQTAITIELEAEDSNPIELQEKGWSAILSNFKHYIEA